VSSKFRARAVLPQGQISIAIEHDAGWASGLYRTSLRKEKSPAPAGIQTPDRPTCSLLVTAHTRLSRFPYRNFIINMDPE
jgi:hypothetical protein